MAIFPQGTGLHRDGLLILGRNAGVEACPERCFGPVEGGGQKPFRDFVFRDGPFFGHFRLPLRPGRRGSFSARVERILLQRDLSGRLTCTRLLQGLPVVPRHPGRRMLGQLLGVFLQFDEVVEGIDAIQFTGVDQAHEQIAHLGAVLGLIK